MKKTSWIRGGICLALTIVVTALSAGCPVSPVRAEIGNDPGLESWARSLKSPYAKSVALIMVADRYFNGNKSSKALTLLDEAERAIAKTPTDQDAINRYFQWLLAQNVFEKSEADDREIKEFIQTTLDQMRNRVRAELAVRYARLRNLQKALAEARLIKGDDRDGTLLDIGETFLAADRPEYAERVSGEIAAPSSRLAMGDAFVHWALKKGMKEAAEKRLTGIKTLLDGLAEEDRAKYRRELAGDYAALGEFFQARSEIMALTQPNDRIEQFRLLAKAAADRGSFGEASDALKSALEEVPALTNPATKQDAFFTIVNQAASLLPAGDAPGWLDSVALKVNAMPEGLEKAAFQRALAEGLYMLKDARRSREGMEQAVNTAMKAPDGPEKVDFLMAVGDRLVGMEMLSQAGKVWTQAATVIARMDAQPDYKAIHFAQVVRAIALKVDSEKALSMIEGKKSIYDRSMAYAEVARGYLEQGRLDEALSLIDLIPNAYRRAMLRTEAVPYLIDAGQADRAAVLLDMAEQEGEGTQDPELKALEEAEIALKYVALGQFEKAEVRFGNIQDVGVRQDKLLKLAEALLESGEPERAVAVLGQYADPKDLFFDYCILSGRSHEWGHLEERDRLMKKALEIADQVQDPSDRDEKLKLAASYYLVYEKHENATDLMDKLSTEEARREGYAHIIKKLMENDRYQQALELANKEKFEALVEVALIRMARQYEEAGREDEAVRCVRSLRNDILRGEALEYALDGKDFSAENRTLLSILSLSVL